MPRLLLAALLVLLAATPAAAHKLKVFAAIVGDEVQGRVYFVGGGAAIGVPVTLTDAGATVLATTTTAPPDGTFVLPLTPAAVTVTADAQDGHVAQFVLGNVPASAAPAATTSSAAVDTATLDIAIARQVAPLADEIDALRDSLGLRDIIGGIGYILGAFGLWAFLAARRPR